jgi:hypothetical protein
MESVAVHPAIKHGTRSPSTRQRFLDKRTREGQMIAGLKQSIIDDLGGVANLNARETFMIDSLIPRFVTLFLISNYIDRNTEKLINKNHNLIPIIRDSYPKYIQSIEQTLDRLYRNYDTKKSAPTLDDILRPGRIRDERIGDSGQDPESA